ncbi:hypothetical protein F4824DRAFT_445434 [Ustulina deusta]|nr:hypothetical protein F4824DRAFT_445434 [Ustulina deusta]
MCKCYVASLVWTAFLAVVVAASRRIFVVPYYRRGAAAIYCLMPTIARGSQANRSERGGIAMVQPIYLLVPQYTPFPS